MKWDYYADSFFNGDMEAYRKELSRLGEEGWDLVAVSPVGIHIFKRVKG